MIHAGVLKQVEVRPETRDSFPGGPAQRVRGLEEKPPSCLLGFKVKVWV